MSTLTSKENSMILRTLILSLTLLAVSISLYAKSPYNYRPTMSKVYGVGLINEPTLLYTGCSFNISTLKPYLDSCAYDFSNYDYEHIIHFDHVVSVSRVKRHLGCHKSKSSITCNYDKLYGCLSDGHNIYPTLDTVNLSKGSRRLLPLNKHFTYPYGKDPGIKMSNGSRVMEPGDNAKGQVARASLYMDLNKCIELTDYEKKVYSIWSENYPPTLDDVIRNELIHQHQSRRNAYINTGPYIDTESCVE